MRGLAAWAIGAFWAVTGASALVHARRTASFLATVLGEGSNAGVAGIAIALAAMQVAVGCAVLIPGMRRTGAFMGLAQSGLMLIGVSTVFRRARGQDCGCLNLFGIDHFGLANILVLAGVMVAFLGTWLGCAKPRNALDTHARPLHAEG